MSNVLIRGERPALTRWEKLLIFAAWQLLVSSVLFLGLYLWLGIVRDAQYPFAANASGKDIMLVILPLLLIVDVRRFTAFAVPLIVLAHLFMVIILLFSIGVDDTKLNNALHDLHLPQWGTPFRYFWLAAASWMVLQFAVCRWFAERSRYDMRYLPPPAFRALMATAEVLVLEDEREIAPAEVAGRVDHYLARFESHDKYRVRLALLALAYWPLLSLRPPLYLMSRGMRKRFIERRFLAVPRGWLLLKWFRDTRQGVIRTAQQFSFFGYYGDARAAVKVGYVPFSERYDYDKLIKNVDPNPRRVECMSPSDVTGEELVADVVIVGTGAGGAMLAYQLAKDGRSVLLLERGRHVDPSTFSEDEAEQLSRLYADGALTLSKDFRFQVLQGMCVGGSTVVNNAVCLRIPDHVRDRWNGDELRAAIDRTRLDAAYDEVEEFLRVAPIGPKARLNPGGELVAAAINGIPADRSPGRFEPFPCNIQSNGAADRECLGCGYCNIGCKFGKKLSALDWTLPMAQKQWRERVQILPECRVERVIMQGHLATGVEARLGDGRRITVNARTVVLSAGAVASSIILRRSGLGDGRAGDRLGFNLGSPVTLDFGDVPPVHSERGAQMTYRFTGAPEGTEVETWFNPVVTQSLFMPGWFKEHRQNMLRYRYMTCLGLLVGSESNASVRPTRIGSGVKLDYTPTDADFVKLKRAVKFAAELGLEAGAKRVMPSTFHSITIRDGRDLGLIDTRIGDTAELQVSSSHPQGGNPMSEDAHIGVVDPDLRVYGTTNVYVCDASVFPSAITVNPQLTVMALAAYAAPRIA